jgi:hypothetical protein
MELLLKRGETKNSFGQTKYELFAKLEPTPEEEILLKKAKTATTYLAEIDQATITRLWRKAQLIGAILAIIAGIIIGAVTHLMLFWLVTPLAWLVLRKVVFNHIREDFSVKDLLTGHTLRSNSMETIVNAEQELRKNAVDYNKYLHAMEIPAEPQRIRLEPE